MQRAGRTILRFDLRREGLGLGSLSRTMVDSGVGVSIAGAKIGISGVLIGVLLVDKSSSCETGMKAGPTLGDGAGVRGEGRLSIG